ncbi:class I SAM-dependent methyltransferase [Fulvivirga lutea]|uniref:Class I SAM-dependent methyltransferase n=1 Tax=Fulvivirga lutea TaxID=2810512 RepID=A0A974WFM7_9BACT|nr:class I SAM-dependent methyltransferase [Fulvivirga lutea]QSE96638.1 class I SAM-dependent methyltransferase [Fulvivirga lutea]
MKDKFSKDSDNYGKYRPTYPEGLYDYIKSKLNGRSQAWDCATGNGQVAGRLAEIFEKVEATDLSANQIKHAIIKSNIHYSVQVAEKTNFSDHQFNLITVGQALHWFNFDQFFKEVKRVLKPDGVLIAFGYGLNYVNAEVDEIIKHFYFNIIGPYWDDERKHIDDKYQSISFPFDEVQRQNFHLKVAWDINHYLGYLNTWSAVKHYQKKNGKNPVDQIKADLNETWGSMNLEVTFPIFTTCAYG